MRYAKDGGNTATVKSIEELPTGNFKVTAEALTPKDVARVEISLEKVEYEDRTTPNESTVKQAPSLVASARPELLPGDVVRAVWFYTPEIPDDQVG